MKRHHSNPGIPDFSLEETATAAGDWPCAGVDEAGRGPLAGPVVAAAVILDPNNIPAGLNDSKQLSASKRAMLFEVILRDALAISAGSVSAETIDGTDIRQATLMAMRRAVCGLAVLPRYVLIDGRDVPRDLPCAGEAVIKGDGRSQSIAAASIVAKVLRDRMLQRVGHAYPAYGLQTHAGYGTAAHRDAIQAHGGVARMHRFTFSPLKATDS